MLHDARMATLATLLDVATLRARVHAGNIANVNTPGYRSRAVSFEDDFRRAMQRGEVERALDMEPVVHQPRSSAVRKDGNDVSMDREVTLAAQNNVLYNTYVALLRGKHRLINTAIDGRV